MWQTVVGAMSNADVSTTLNTLGKEIDDAFHVDIKNSILGVVSLQQPVFMGGKIVATNKMAKLAEELQGNQYDLKYQDVIVNVDQAYWQVVSVAAKKRLAESYADLLHSMQHNVAISVAEGVATASDSLQIEVKANEADMLLTKADNGLILSKMLLCKLIGLPLDSQITLADENSEVVAMPQFTAKKDLEQIYEDRPETKSLDLATQIYQQKYYIARSDMLPKVALTANYLMSNHNLQNGFEKEYGDMFSAGVIVNIPIFHGFEALNKTRKAKAEQQLYVTQLDDAKEKIALQVTQLRQQQDENIEKYYMAQHNVESAEENLRKATIGFEAGVIDTDTALGAQTAWLQANSEFIDAGIDLQMNNVEVLKAEGCYTSDRETDGK
jgi:outer membrane protein TolC